MSITPGYKEKKKFIMVATRRPEDTPSTDYIANGASPVAIQTSGLSVEPLVTEQINRELDNGADGGEPVIHINEMIKITAPFELTGSGDAAAPTAFAKMLQLAGRDINTDVAGEVSHNRITTASQEIDGCVYFYWEGMYHKAFACKATLTRSGTTGDRLMCSAEVTGVYGGTLAGTPPTPDFGNFQKPLPMGELNTSFNIDGQALNLYQYEVADNATIEYDEGTEQKRIFIDNWSEEAKWVIEAPELGTFDPFAILLSNVEVPFGFTHGIAAGEVWEESSTGAQFLTVKPTAEKGKKCWEITARVIKGHDAVLKTR
ncbi:hypothetical protein [Alteromonas confluentis]|uniref:Phage tail protein n=1 Tax=Alteromonas confluentis TaxID=1656094 RepID=A0A1E7ZE82_9ALTE|nr:hypothetical protein [Alteromonas confluentis]OFC71816.1 hypothetical protein BFC18_06585 [Alteromonas confluentis]